MFVSRSTSARRPDGPRRAAHRCYARKPFAVLGRGALPSGPPRADARQVDALRVAEAFVLRAELINQRYDARATVGSVQDRSMGFCGETTTKDIKRPAGSRSAGRALERHRPERGGQQTASSCK